MDKWKERQMFQWSERQFGTRLCILCVSARGIPLNLSILGVRRLPPLTRLKKPNGELGPG